MKQYIIITKLLTSINIFKKIFLTLRKMIKYQYKENCILRFVGIREVKGSFGKRHNLWLTPAFINELDLREVSFPTLVYCILRFVGILVKRKKND